MLIKNGVMCRTQFFEIYEYTPNLPSPMTNSDHDNGQCTLQGVHTQKLTTNQGLEYKNMIC